MDAIAEIRRARVIPVLRMSDAEAAVDAARRLLDSDLFLVELAATTPGWQTALPAIRSSHPDAVIGVGTITTRHDARFAIDEGANFLVCPHLSADVRAEAGKLLIEGGMTPGEIAAAAQHNLAKLFPAHVFGPSYLQSILAVLPWAKIMPTGGIKLDEVASWFAVGAFAVGVGSGIDYMGDAAKTILQVIAELPN